MYSAAIGKAQSSFIYRSRHLCLARRLVVGGMSGVRFPALHDVGERPTLSGLDRRMHMVGHHAPGDQAVALVVEVQQSVLHKGREALVAQPAGAMAGVLVAEETLPDLDLRRAGGR